MEKSVFAATASAYDGQPYGNETVQALREALEEAQSAVAPATASWAIAQFADGSEPTLGQPPPLKPVGPSMDIAEIPPYVPKEVDEKAVSYSWQL